MANESTPLLPEKAPGQSLWQRVSNRLTGAHASIRDIGERRKAQLTATLSFILVVALGIGLIFQPTSILTFLILFFISLITYFLSRTKLYILGAYFLTFGLLVNAFLPLYLGTANDFALGVFSITPLVLILANGLLPFSGQVILTAVATLAAFLAPLYANMETPNIYAVGGSLLSFGLVLIGLRRFAETSEKIRLDEIRRANQSLEEIRQNLEVRVEERTAELGAVSRDAQRRALQLEAVAEVAREIARIQDLDALLPAVTRLISEHFNFYHVGIFLLEGEYAVLRAANSEGGQKMLARQHRLKIGQTGIVGYAAARGEARIALDVGADAVFFENLDLPLTRSEMAVPLSAGTRINGVLDVQSLEAGAFRPEDIEVMRTLADQVSIALENARLFSETRHALGEVQQAYARTLREAWSVVAKEMEPNIGYQHNPAGTSPLTKAVENAEVQAALTTGVPVLPSKDQPGMAIPLKHRGGTIGVLNVRAGASGRSWSPDEIAAIQSIAERVALALENARLLEETSRRADRERTVSEITTKIRSTSDPQIMLETVVEELKKVLGTDEIHVRPVEIQSAGQNPEALATEKMGTRRPAEQVPEVPAGEKNVTHNPAE
jgi:GAF domain-containing protein